MKKDIENREDIRLLINYFYQKVTADPLIGFIFTDVAKVNWEKHLPVMYDFWENSLFYTGGYTGNPLQLHQRLNRVCPLRPAHFERWLELFNETVDELHAGEKSELAKQRAYSISTVIRLKLGEAESESNKIF